MLYVVTAGICIRARVCVYVCVCMFVMCAGVDVESPGYAGSTGER